MRLVCLSCNNWGLGHALLKRRLIASIVRLNRVRISAAYILSHGLICATATISTVLAQIVQKLPSAVGIIRALHVLSILSLVLVAHQILLSLIVVLLISALQILLLASLLLVLLALLRDAVHVLSHFLNSLSALNVCKTSASTAR